MTTTVTVNLDLPAGYVGGDFGGAFAPGLNVTPGALAASVSLTATDSTGGPSAWTLAFQYGGYPGRRSSITTPVPAGPANFAVNSAALTTLAWAQDSSWVTAFPNGLPVGTQITVTGGSLPSGLTAGTYYVLTTALNGFTVSATAGGSVVTCTGPGTGTFTVAAYNYTGLLTATQARSTTNPAFLPYPAGTAASGNLVTADDAGNPLWQAPAAPVNNRLQPSDVGLLAWTYPPFEYNSTFGLRAGNGWFYVFRFKTGAACTVNNILYAVTTAAAGTAQANVFLGIYDDVSTLLGSCSVDQVTNMSGTGAKTAALSAPLTLAANTVYRIGLCVGTAAGTTQPSLASGAASAAGAYNNVGITAAKSVGIAAQNAAYTSLPTPITFSGLGAQAGLPVFVMT